MDLRNLKFPSFYCIYSRLPRNGVGGVHVFHECLPTSATKTYPKVTTFRKGRRDGDPVAPTISGRCLGIFKPGRLGKQAHKIEQGPSNLQERAALGSCILSHHGWSTSPKARQKALAAQDFEQYKKSKNCVFDSTAPT